MKNILISLSVIGIVSAIAVGGTIAFFSDTETSTGNTFTAGELDLKFQVRGLVGEAPTWTDVNNAPLFATTAIPLLGDMKPGDTGKRAVRLWVDDNPACGKVSVDVTEDKDNTCTEPEGKDEMKGEGVSPTPGCDIAVGELNDQVNFAVWEDNSVSPGLACNNIMDGGETPLISGPLTSNKAYSIGELPLTQATAKCYGVAYCFGTFGAGGTCNGALVNNAAQSDSFKASIIIDALQERNQFPEGCPAVGDWPPAL